MDKKLQDTRVGVSTGLGRLHFVETVQALREIGVNTQLITGWVPATDNSLLLKIASKLTGRDLSAGMRKRRVGLESGRFSTCAASEWIDHGIGLLASKLHLRSDWLSVLGTRLFGWQSRSCLRGNSIFHVRSGFGQGGAIARARKLGQKILVDHSIAHPAFMETAMADEFVRNGVPFRMGPDDSLWKLVLKDCAEADILLVNSDFVKKTFVDNGYDPNKIRVAYLGVRSDFFGLRSPDALRESKPLKLLFTGYFGFRKGAEYILEALRTLQEEMKVPFTLDVVGAFAGTENIIRRFADFHLPVRFHGPIPQDDLKAFLSESDVYVFPSLAEGCAKSGMEAMAAGLCVVATEESGLPIADGENGYIVPSKDARALAERLAWLYAHRSEIDRTGGNAARIVAEEYTWRRYAENVKAVYEELLGK